MRRLVFIGILVVALALPACVFDAGSGPRPKLKKATVPGFVSPPRGESTTFNLVLKARG